MWDSVIYIICSVNGAFPKSVTEALHHLKELLAEEIKVPLNLSARPFC